MQRLHAALRRLLHLVLVLGLACSPLAQPMALAALAVPQQQGIGGCPLHAQAGKRLGGLDKLKPGECCCKKGSPCHCAMTIALPVAAVLATAPQASDHPVSVPHLAASTLTPPEPPPPRS